MTIRDVVMKAIKEEIGSDIAFSIECQENPKRGDYSSNAAMALAQKQGKPPLEVAKNISEAIFLKQKDVFKEVAVAGPGFLNFFIKDEYIYDRIKEFVKEKRKERKKTSPFSLKLRRVSVEFISANPTGPLHIGNARGGPIGDVIAHLLEETGYKVIREYFHNDAGAQVGAFRDSLWHWYLLACGKESHMGEIQYASDYVKEFADKAKGRFKDKFIKKKDGKERLLQFVFDKLLRENFETIKAMGIHFDKVTHESKLAKLKTKKVLDELEKKRVLKRKEGAVWFSPGGEYMKEREAVLVKNDGTYLYFANDIAYHKEKFKRNDVVVDVLGEGHQGHIPKLYAVAEVFGFPKEHFKIIVHGQVNLLKEGNIVSMSKRKGHFVTAREVLDEVGKDAFRFFLLAYSPRTAISFDIDLAKEQSKKNPVYYVQYAHARASAILQKSKKGMNLKNAAWEILQDVYERRLLLRILSFYEALEDTARDFEVQRFTKYAYELARSFTDFYENVRVLGGSKNEELARLALVKLTQKTLARTLALLGVTAPKRM